MNFIIDDEFREYLFHPDAMCDEELERSIKENYGARDKLIVAELPEGKRYLIDGHRRHRLCEKLGLPYSIETVKLASREEIFDFMDHWQLTRRNLAPNQLAILRARIVERHVADAKQKKSEALAAAAEEQGVSSRTAYRDVCYNSAIEAISPEIREEVVAKLPRKQAIKMAEFPHSEQIRSWNARKAVSEGKKAAIAKAKDKKKLHASFEDAVAVAGKLVAKLQNALADVNKAKKDELMLKSAKGHARSVGNALDRWGKTSK